MKKRGFTLIELVFVIAIVGFLGTILSQIFASIYSNYYESKVQNELEQKTQVALDQIVRRLSFRIKPSVIISQGGAFASVESAPATPGNYAVEWIAYDNDSFRGMATAASPGYTMPGWSGFIDLNAITDGITLSSPGSDFTNIATPIISSETNGSVNLSLDAAGAAIIFPDAPGTVNDYGWYGTVPALVHPVYAPTATTLRSTTVSGRNFQGVNNEVYENYKLVVTAYALDYNNTNNNLTLYSNYRPWNGETYAQNGTANLLLEDVSTFRFLQVGDIIKVQLCVQTPAVFDANSSYSICKEKAVY